jgi:hypothetical protein
MCKGERWKGGRIRTGRGQDGKCGVPLLFVVVRGCGIAERGWGKRGMGCLCHQENIVDGLFGQEGWSWSGLFCWLFCCYYEDELERWAVSVRWGNCIAFSSRLLLVSIRILPLPGEARGGLGNRRGGVVVPMCWGCWWESTCRGSQGGGC